MNRQGQKPLCDLQGLPLLSLRDVNALPLAKKEAIYSELIPPQLLQLFAIDPSNLRGEDGLKKVTFIAPVELGLLRLELRLHPGDRDSVFFVELADTPYRQLELSFCLINDPSSERYDIDRDASGRDNNFGTVRRNITEEVRAMNAGLSPHQVRRGLGMFHFFFRRLERFAALIGIDAIVAEALSYCNAVRYERYGFDYITGKQKMLLIEREFAPGGRLYQRLDRSTPFRQPGMEKSVRGRSWAIHDGILGEPWDGVRIYKTLGIDAGVKTFGATGKSLTER